MMRYPGGKNGGGAYQVIINQIPPHRVYVEPFAGSAAILRMKRPAERNLAIDLDPAAIDALAGVVPLGTDLQVGDGIEFLEQWCPPDRAFVYADPPYLETVSPQRYAHKLDQTGHRRLLAVLCRLPCHVLLSGYRSPLYSRMLRDWRQVEYTGWTRGGPAVEVLWANYPEPEQLHDYRFLGSDHRQRLDIRRQQKRWQARLERMSRLQRLAMLSVLADFLPGSDGSVAIEYCGGENASAAGRRRRE